MKFPELVENLSRQLWYRMWSEDLECFKDQSMMVVGRRAGMTEDEVNLCLQVGHVVLVYICLSALILVSVVSIK